MKKIKFKKRKLSKESEKITIQEVNENEEFKKIRKSDKIYFKKKILKSLKEELNMMSKICKNHFKNIIKYLKRIKKLIKTIKKIQKLEENRIQEKKTK